MPLPLPILPEDNTEICLTIPNSPEWRQIYMGTLQIMAQWWYWQVDNPIDAQDVVQRVMECAAITGGNYEGCMELDCNDVLECIETNEDIQRAIANFAGISNVDSGSTENSGNLSSELVNNPDGCDDDIIFGMCVQLVEFADRLIKDLFEQLDASQLASVNVGYIIKLIPVLETLPLDEAFEFTNKVVNDMEIAYLSASTQLLKDEIACDLFCIAKANDCVLTLEAVRDYYQEKADIVFSYDDVFAFIVDFTNGTFIGNAVYYGMNILFFQIFVFGGKFLEYYFRDYLRVIQSMYNDPNSDWSTLCDECGWVWESNFLDSENIWQPQGSAYGDRATWTVDVGYESVDIQTSGTVYSRICLIETDEFTPTAIDRIVLTYDVTIGTYDVTTQNAIQLVLIRDNDSAVTEEIQAQNVVNGSALEFEWNNINEDDIKQIWVMVRSSARSIAAYSGVAKPTIVRVEGSGDNPFV